MALVNWKKDKNFWKGGNSLCYHSADEGAVLHHYIQVVKVDAEDSPHFGLWKITYNTEHKKGSDYVSSRQKAVSFVRDYMRKYDY